MIELIVALTLSLFVGTFILWAFGGTFKGAHMQTRRAETVREMISAKIKISKILDQVDSLTLVASDKIMFTNKGDPAIHTLAFQDSALNYDGAVVEKSMKSFSFSPSERKTSDRRRLVDWEGVLSGNGWVGGALVAFDGTHASL